MTDTSIKPLDLTAASAAWHPVATEHDVTPRSLFRGQLLGHEIVAWRADDGFVNVWENRCLHRGVRLSIGTNNGSELVCRYHAWRYANRSAGCTYIPAHPADSPARTITNRTFPTVERYGLIWTGHDPLGDAPTFSLLEEGPSLGLRNLAVHAPASVVLEHLSQHRFLPTASIASGSTQDLASVSMTTETSPYSVTLTSTTADGESAAVFFVQPINAQRSVIRPVLAEAPADAMAVLRHHATRLALVVREIEQSLPIVPAADQQSALPVALETPVVLPTVATAVGRSAPIRVVVRRKWNTADAIAAFELAPTGDTQLPVFQPGAHIDVHLASGLVRQYSITNGPAETDCYRIAVKREPDSRGGSAAMHDQVQQGDELQISEPRNSFPLRRNIPHTTLIAGGIGVTPLLSMAQALNTMGMDFDLHYFVSAADAVAFRDELERFDARFHTHVGLSPDETAREVGAVLASPDPTRQVYACGPPPMLDAIRSLASDRGWPADSVHFEYFKNTTELDQGSAFTVDLARSGLSLDVASGKTILEVLREHDVPIVSSCEQGACGTCAATVLEGEPLHQDVYLNPTERAAGFTILTCVSRATSDRLVLDL